MPDTIVNVDLREATLDDAGIVAELDTLRDPEEPRNPVRLRHWWRMTDRIERSMRRVAVRDGAAIAYVSGSHAPWTTTGPRFGTIRVSLRPDLFAEDRYGGLVDVAESWLRSEGAMIAVARVREDFAGDLRALVRLGYAEDRRSQTSELDLVTDRGRLLAAREEWRRRMREQGVVIRPVSEDGDPDRLPKLHAAIMESESDIPTTVPWHAIGFEEWREFWFANPAIREDHFWIAREGADIVGASVLDTPVGRGVPWTAYTGTLRRVRGRGIARALKYESIGQAIEDGHSRVRTNNDADNPAILHINREMGYRLVAPLLELHRKLDR